MRLKHKLDRLERVVDQREAAAPQRTGDEVDPLLALLKLATIEELRRFRDVVHAIPLRKPMGDQPEDNISLATESESQELASIIEILQKRLAAERAGQSADAQSANGVREPKVVDPAGEFRTAAEPIACAQELGPYVVGYDKLELIKGNSNGDGQGAANQATSSPTEVKPVEVATPPLEEAGEKVTLTYTVCGFRDQDGETCCWGLESREAAAAWLRETYATACQGMNEFWLIRDDNHDAAAVYARVNDGELSFALVNGEPVSL